MSFVAAIDQGTTSSRFLVFDGKQQIVASHQLEHKQLTPSPGFLEHDPKEIYLNVVECIAKGKETFDKKFPGQSIAAIGITNQRETTVAWDGRNGKPLCNAIVWSDGRTQGVVERLSQKYGPTFAKERAGLPLSTYFSAVKMVWMLENHDTVKTAFQERYLRFGTIDSWLMWNLTKGSSHVTDVTNASRTMLMNLRTLQWDEDLCEKFGIPLWSLPKIVSCSEVIAKVSCKRVPQLADVPLAGCIGDQQGALVGHMCLAAGEAKNTYGTGCFLLSNVGTTIKHSEHGLLATVGYKFGSGPAHYALEGSVAGAGSCIQWLRDKLAIITDAKSSEELARTVESSGGVVFVPAFSGLLAPYWDPDARGTIVGLTQQSTRAHVVRAALEAVAHQVSGLIRAMELDSGSTISSLAVDGGMVANSLLMQLQADLAQIEVRIPSLLESTALGAAICAGIAVESWRLADLEQNVKRSKDKKTVTPAKSSADVEQDKKRWKEAVQRSRGWAKL